MEKKFKVAGIGELLWDVLPSGKKLGGAPFNFAYHSSQMGCESYIFSAVGYDELGEEIIAKVNQFGLNSRYLQKNNYPTSTVTVRLNENGHPNYTIHEKVAWDYMHWNAKMNELSDKIDAVCFGSLAQRTPVSAQTINSFLGELKQDCLKVFDINLRQQYYNKENINKSLHLAWLFRFDLCQ